GRDDDDVGALGLVVAVRARHPRLVAEHRGRLVDVERLPLREVRDDVDEDDVGVVAAGDLLRPRGGGVRRAPARGLGSRTRAPSLSMIASAYSAVPTADGSSRNAFMSYVTLVPSASTAATASSSRRAASASPRCSSISFPERIIAVGLTLFCPVYFGA